MNTTAHSTIPNTIDDVSLALKETLQRNGKLDSIRASLRSEVFQSLQLALQHKYSGDNNHFENDKENIEAQVPNDEIEICHELICDFLQCSGLVHTLSTFKAETSSNCNIASKKRSNKDTDEELIKAFEKKVDGKGNKNHFYEDFKIFQNGKRVNESGDDARKGIPLLLKMVDSIQME